MRIIGGTFRGHRLRAPKGPTRPTTDRTREAIFNLLQSRVALHDVRVLDLFAGSGALGLEALSRGAASATFVEQGGAALGTIRQNADALGVAARCSLHRADALRFLAVEPAMRYDLVLADPPYDLDALERLPDLILPHVAAEGLLVLEHGDNVGFDAHPALEMSRAYGQTVVSLFRPVVESA
ncbi:MAG: 16S rRNA (guanine(966)-N(2))-methyltransferase RsmD [Rhodothermales bacterium]